MANMKKATVFLLAAVMVLGLAACSKKTGGKAPKGQNYLKIGSLLDAAMNLDPITTTYNWVYEIDNAVFNQLVQPDPVTMELKPYLIENFPEVSADSTVFTFHLKKGVKFHDGAELKSKDVEFTFNRFFDPEWNNVNMWMADFILGAQEMMEGKASSLAGFKVIDDYTFSIELQYPYTAFVAILAIPPLAIMPKDACEKAGKRWGIDTMIGTGQYKLKSFKPGVELIIERNNSYWGPKAKLDGVQWNHMLAETQLLEWEAGTIDICAVDVGLVDGYMEKYPNNVREQEYVGTHWLSFNFDIPPFNDARVREAVGLATNADALCQDYFKGHVKRAKGIIPPGIVGHDPARQVRQYNPERARQLLAEAGYPNGIDIEATVRETNSSWVEIYQIFQEQYKLANIRLTIDRVDAAGWTEKRSTGHVQYYMINWYADFLDPDNFLFSIYNSGTANFFSTGFRDKYFDEQLAKGRTLPISEKQKFYSELDTYLLNEKTAAWPLYTPAGYILTSDRVKDVYVKNDFLFTFEIGYLAE
jgi:peptide/nickel transport system substrate-binding protein